ncbi:MAG: hypothetical protein IKG85_07630, partial [Clostridia bacterium]|nr:hypothetical protein [Clostridia bacterium]
MSKRSFGTPFVMGFPGMTEEPDPTEVVGGSSHGDLPHNKTPFACSFDTWSEKFRSDTYKDGLIDFNDYGQWWADSGLGMEAWE